MIVRQAIDQAGALQHMARAVAFDCLGDGTGDVRELVGDSALFELVDGDKVVGAFALSVDDYSDGRVIRCAAAGGEPGHDLLPEVVGFAESEARTRIGARLLTCETSRPGMVRRLERLGFRVAGFIMSKDV